MEKGKASRKDAKRELAEKTWHGAPLPMTFHGRDARATLLETFQPGHGGVERDTVVVEARVPRRQGRVLWRLREIPRDTRG